jgi:2-(1,2-epoxy-1,2-dihydrophenyl)acetyl-CoA isomerase
MSDYPPEIIVGHQKNGVVVATLNRPEVLNALNGAMRAGIRQLITRVNADHSARVLVLTGAGSAFCSGADLGATDGRSWPRGPADPEFSWCVDLLQMPKPTIAAVNGVAAGGGLGISFLCDFRFCSQSSRLLPVWAKRGIHPDDLVTWTLPKLAGYSRALKWLYAGTDIPLPDAENAGLIEPVVADKDLMPTAMKFANNLATGPTVQYALTKQAVLKSLNSEPWDSALLESWGQNTARQTSDFKEGINAFREKRKAKFTGE